MFNWIKRDMILKDGGHEVIVTGDVRRIPGGDVVPVKVVGPKGAYAIGHRYDAVCWNLQKPD